MGERHREQYDKLLRWLDPDPVQGNLEYASIRRRLIQVFANRGSPVPEELADETIDRVAAHVDKIAPSYVGNPALHFYGVARNVFWESTRDPARRAIPIAELPREPSTPSTTEPGDDVRIRCLDRCLAELKPAHRELILAYYEGEKAGKIRNRKALAESRGIDVNALRIRVSRIRSRLRECVEQCMRPPPDADERKNAANAYKDESEEP